MPSPTTVSHVANASPYARLRPSCPSFLPTSPTAVGAPSRASCATGRSGSTDGSRPISICRSVPDTVLISHERGRPAFNSPYLRIVWEDESLIVIDKRDGLLSVSDSVAQERTAWAILSAYVREQDPRNRIFVLHRLDRGTSGLMMFARNKGVQEKMREGWADIVTRRSYVAVVEGVPEPAEDTLRNFLAENSRMKVYCTDALHGKEAVTHYRVLKAASDCALVEFTLETGRKNQIRAQMEAFGHPIAGDPKYGAQTDPAERLMLHACRLWFIHPETGREMRFDTPIPAVFSAQVRDRE